MTDLRDFLFAKDAVFAKKKVEIEGRVFEIREPSIADYNSISKKALKIEDAKSGRMTYDFEAKKIATLIATVFDPSTGQKVFTEEDKDVILAQPTSSAVGQLLKEAEKMINDLEGFEAKKNDLQVGIA
jgi:hypothetical protein